MKKLKKTLCILISVLMLTAFMPIVALAGENQVTVDNDIVLNADTPYYVNGVASGKGSLGKDGCTAYYDTKTGTLYVQKYRGGSITSDSDLTILVKSGDENILRNDFNTGIYVKGDLTITGEGDEADFEVYAGPKGICADGNITISNIDYCIVFADKTAIESGSSKDITISGNNHTAS